MIMFYVVVITCGYLVTVLYAMCDKHYTYIYQDLLSNVIIITQLRYKYTITIAVQEYIYA